MKGKIRTLIIFESFAAFIGIVSAIGSSCPTFNPGGLESTSALLPVMMDLQWVFILTTLLSYAAAIVSGVLIWALIAKEVWFYPVAIITSIVGIASGLTPALLVILNGMSFSPSLMRTVVYAVVLILLLLPPFYELKFKTTEGIEISSKDAQISENTAETSVKSSMMTVVSLIIMSIGIGLFIQPFMVTSSHLINGVNYFTNGPLYTYFGIALIILSAVIFASTYIHKVFSLRNQNNIIN